MKIMLVVNPSASGVNARNRVMIQNALSADHDLTVAETSRRGHATRLAQGAAATAFDIVVALGGDGTLNEVANGLAQTSTAMAVLPGGSTNVFARTLGLTNEPVEATEQVLAAIARNSIRGVSLGNVNGRYFCFHVGLGFDAAVVEAVERRGQLKRWLGHLLFAWSAIDTWGRTFDRKNPPFAVTIDGRIPVDGFFSIVLNTDPYTYFGSRPLALAPGNTLDNPLSVVTMRTMALGTVVGAFGAALRAKPITHKKVAVEHGVREVVVRGHRPFPWQVDGDHLGDADELTFRWEPDAIRIVMP